MTSYAFENRVLEVAIEGRVTAEAIGGSAAALDEALASPGSFGVCFDRSRMTAVTKEGRAALEQWAGS